MKKSKKYAIHVSAFILTPVEHTITIKAKDKAEAKAIAKRKGRKIIEKSGTYDGIVTKLDIQEIEVYNQKKDYDDIIK